MVDLAHEGHQGEAKTKKLLRSKVWFPKLDKLCEVVVKECILCQAATPQTVRAPLKMTDLPNGPWENLSIDFGHVGNDYVMVIIDDYSRYPVVEVVSSTSAAAIIPNLDKVFGMFGIPKVVKTDNGPPFNSDNFAKFAKHLGFKHRKVTPLWPEANGGVERFMRTFRKVLLTSNHWKQDMVAFLRNYRATPHSTTGYAPATILLGRDINVKIPSFSKGWGNDDLLRKNDQKNKINIKLNAEKN
ncbi:uncharacterized protein K02A2.6-like [Anneissia japonica]|uniref:uncharacterized protein K02A2.6-like n=1 Tax=Anneissia japonica TaxID=1529436 RepID=UPI0014259996|nr:uncharacterized protein K02A2.6-like [Anneissia japonica]